MPSRFNVARWVTSDNAKKLAQFLEENAHRTAEDVVGAPVLLTAHKSELDVVQERWPDIQFHALREHAGLIFQSEMGN